MARRKRPSSPNHPRYWPSHVGVAIFWLLGQLPWNLLLWLGHGLGHLSWYLARSRRHTAEVNIRLCFPELGACEQQALAHRSVVSVGEALMEMAGTYCNRRIDLRPRVEFNGLERVKQAQARGQGVILLGMHFNTLDVAARMLSLEIPYSAVYRPNDNPVIEKLIRHGRGSRTREYIPRDDMRRMIRLLRQGEAIWYAPDQDYGRDHAVYVPFFGHPAATITATARLARMGRAVVIPVAHYRLPGGRYVLEFGEELTDFPSGEDEADARRINETVEAFVRKCPEQYLWVHRRFKHQPEGLPNPYKASH